MEQRERAVDALGASLGPDRRADLYEHGATMPAAQVTNMALDTVICALGDVS